MVWKQHCLIPLVTSETEPLLFTLEMKLCYKVNKQIIFLFEFWMGGSVECCVSITFDKLTLPPNANVKTLFLFFSNLTQSFNQWNLFFLAQVHKNSLPGYIFFIHKFCSRNSLMKTHLGNRILGASLCSIWVHGRSSHYLSLLSKKVISIQHISTGLTCMCSRLCTWLNRFSKAGEIRK